MLMELSCLVIDDERHARELLAEYISGTPGLRLQGVYASAVEALHEFNGPNPPALVYLDVDMPGLNGIDFAAMVNRISTVVFTTAYREYALEAFEQNAADYLLKPIAYPRFLSSWQKVQERARARENPAPPEFFLLKTEVKGKLARVNIADILFVESIGNYVLIHLGKEKVTAYLTLAETLAHLPPAQFSRVHKSFVVAHQAIRSIEQGQLKLADGTAVPIGRAYAGPFMQAMQPFLLASKRST